MEFERPPPPIPALCPAEDGRTEDALPPQPTPGVKQVKKRRKSLASLPLNSLAGSMRLVEKADDICMDKSSEINQHTISHDAFEMRLQLTKALNEVDRLTFLLENAEEDNQILQELNSTLQKALEKSGHEKGASLMAIEPDKTTAIDYDKPARKLYLSSRIHQSIFAPEPPPPPESFTPLEGRVLPKASPHNKELLEPPPPPASVLSLDGNTLPTAPARDDDMPEPPPPQEGLLSLERHALSMAPPNDELTGLISAVSSTPSPSRSPPPPPPPPPPPHEENRPRRSRRRSVIVKYVSTRLSIEHSKEASGTHFHSDANGRAAEEGLSSFSDSYKSTDTAATAKSSCAALDVVRLPSVDRLEAIHTEAELLSTAFEAAILSSDLQGHVGEMASAVDDLRRFVHRLGALAISQRQNEPTSRSRRVRFAAHNLSGLSPPKAQKPGSEAPQETLIDMVAALCAEQHRMWPKFEPATEVSTISTFMFRCLSCFCAALVALANEPHIEPSLRLSAKFYAGEFEQWASERQPVLGRRLSEMLSSIMRFHLSMIFAEEEGGTDPLLESIRDRVRDHSSAYGFQVMSNEGAEEHFSAVVSNALLQLSRHEHLVAPGGELSAAVTSGEASKLHDLEPEQKDALLSWAQSEAVLLQVFGPREQMLKLRSAHANETHFSKLAQYAQVVHDLALPDEIYFTPLRDLDELQRKLHSDAAKGRAIQESLLIYAMNGKRRSRRQSIVK